MSYTLLMSLIEYKTLVLREEVDAAQQLLPSIPKVLPTSPFQPAFACENLRTVSVLALEGQLTVGKVLMVWFLGRIWTVGLSWFCLETELFVNKTSQECPRPTTRLHKTIPDDTTTTQ